MPGILGGGPRQAAGLQGGIGQVNQSLQGILQILLAAKQQEASREAQLQELQFRREQLASQNDFRQQKLDLDAKLVNAQLAAFLAQQEPEKPAPVEVAAEDDIPTPIKAREEVLSGSETLESGFANIRSFLTGEDPEEIKATGEAALGPLAELIEGTPTTEGVGTGRAIASILALALPGGGPSLSRALGAQAPKDRGIIAARTPGDIPTPGAQRVTLDDAAQQAQVDRILGLPITPGEKVQALSSILGLTAEEVVLQFGDQLGA